MALAVVFATVAGATNLAPPAPAFAAACEPTSTDCHLYGTTSPTYSPTTNPYTANTLELGGRFTVSQTVNITQVSWYRAATSQTRPTAFRLWSAASTGAALWSYTDITDNGAVGWQTTTIPSSLRPLLSSGVTYTLAYGYDGTSSHTRQTGYVPIPDGPISWVGSYYAVGQNTYPSASQSGTYGLDFVVRADTATVTPTPSPTSTPTVGPTSTPTPSPTAGPTSTPTPSPTPGGTTCTTDGGPTSSPLQPYTGIEADPCKAEVHIYRQAATWSRTAYSLASGQDVRAGFYASVAGYGSGEWEVRTWLQCGPPPALWTGAPTSDPAGNVHTVLKYTGAVNYSVAGSPGGTLPEGGVDPASSPICEGGASAAAATWQSGVGTVVYWPSTGKCYYWDSADLAMVPGICGSTQLVTTPPVGTPTGLVCKGTESDPCYIRAPDVVSALGQLGTNLVGALHGIQGAIEQLPGFLMQELQDLATELFVPDASGIDARLEAVEAALNAKLPAVAKVTGTYEAVRDTFAETSCEEWPGLTLTFAMWGTVSVPGAFFMELWCPFRPIVGAGIVLLATWSAGRRVIRLIGGRSQG